MKAVVFHGIGDIRLDNVPEPTIKAPTCGTDLHFVRGTFPGMVPGTIVGQPMQTRR